MASVDNKPSECSHYASLLGLGYDHAVWPDAELSKLTKCFQKLSK